MLEKLRELCIKNILREVAKKDLSYTEVAARAGISRSAFYKIIHGVNEPSMETIEKIAEALGIHYSVLLTPSDRSSVSKITPLEALEIIRKVLTEESS